MTYDLQLGMLATQAMTHLMTAEINQDDAEFREFLLASAAFCRVMQSKATPIDIPSFDSTDVAGFVSAVIKISTPKASQEDRDRLKRVGEIQPLIDRVLDEKRRPNSSEQIQIAEVLYVSSAADLR